jgi:hypothetical protein
VASGQVTGEYLAAEHDEHSPIWVIAEGHPGFHQDIRPRLQSPRARVFRRCTPAQHALIGGKEGDHRLRIAECSFNSLADERAGSAGSTDDLGPFLRLEPDSPQPVEERSVGL